MDEARKVLSDASKRNGRDIEPDKIGTKNINKQRRLLETASFSPVDYKLKRHDTGMLFRISVLKKPSAAGSNGSFFDIMKHPTLRCVSNRDENTVDVVLKYLINDDI
jgi:hypothetical protein